MTRRTALDLNDMLRTHEIAPNDVLVLRHRPTEPGLRKVLPWLAAEKPDLFNAYQQTQGVTLERSMQTMIGSGYVASFIGHEPGKAVFVGLYRIGAARPLTHKQYAELPAYIELAKFGHGGWTPERDDRRTIFWFSLDRTDFYAEWEGKLILDWPPPERSWWRRADRNDIPISAILEESLFAKQLGSWKEMEFTWEELNVLPKSLRSALAQWRGIYYVFDVSDAKGYVGSAYGDENLLGRWLDYGARGHGGNAQLRGRDPCNFRFTILERLSPDASPEDVTRLESSWKNRLHTRTHGLNDN
jgi:hypothetical protein